MEVTEIVVQLFWYSLPVWVICGALLLYFEWKKRREQLRKLEERLRKLEEE
jgi:hypothetical protein